MGACMTRRLKPRKPWPCSRHSWAHNAKSVAVSLTRCPTVRLTTGRPDDGKNHVAELPAHIALQTKKNTIRTTSTPGKTHYLRRARHIGAISAVPILTRPDAKVEEIRVVIRGVGGEDLCRDIQALPLVRDTHVLAEHVVIPHHMQLPDGRACRGVRHPRALPRSLLVDDLFHAARAWEPHLAKEHLSQPGRLQPVSQDVVECRDLAPNECDVLQPRRHHVPVQV